MLNFLGCGHYVMIKTEKGQFPALRTVGQYGKTLPIYCPPRVSAPTVNAFVQVYGKVTINKNGFLLLVIDRWEDQKTGIESRYMPKQDENPGFDGDSPAPDADF